MNSPNDGPMDGESAGDLPELSRDERRRLLAFARAAVEAAARGRRRPVVEPSELTPAMRRLADCFVTLYRHGDLRGCIGGRSGAEELWRAVIESATASATRDPRFLPVEPHELPTIEIEISVLTPQRALTWSDEADLRRKLRPYVHGVSISNGFRRALYLPKVWEHFEGSSDIVAAFLSNLSRKAGDPTGTMWRDPATRYEVFEALDFGESDADLQA